MRQGKEGSDKKRKVEDEMLWDSKEKGEMGPGKEG
jgi:hypothetical protein